MMLLISRRQGPQLVPALSCAPIRSSVEQPAATAAASWFTPTLKQEQTIRPTAGTGTGEQPDSNAMRSAADRGCREASNETSQSRGGNCPGGATSRASA